VEERVRAQTQELPVSASTRGAAEEMK
jgi:hypothetical protein